MSTINTLKAMRDARLHIAELKERRDKMLAVVTETQEYKDLEALLRQVSETESALEELAREDAILEYKATENKHPYPGIEIKMSTSVKYDAEKALAYCLKNMTSVLILDVKKFESAAKVGVVPAEIAEVDDRVPKVYISKDLGKFPELEE